MTFTQGTVQEDGREGGREGQVMVGGWFGLRGLPEGSGQVTGQESNYKVGKTLLGSKGCE